VAAPGTTADGNAVDAAYSQQQQHSNTSLEQLLVLPSGDSHSAMTRGPMQMSFTSSCGGKGGGAGSSHSGSMAVRSEPGAATANGPLNWLFKRPLSRTSSGSSGHVQVAAMSVSSDTHPDLASSGMLPAAAAAAGQQQGQQQLSDVEAGRRDVSNSKLPALSGRQQSGASFGSAISYILGDGSRGDSGSTRRSATTDTPSFSGRLQSKSSLLLHRLTNRSSRQSSLVGPLGSTGLQQQQQVKALRICVRIGIASGTLQYDSDLQNCEVTRRAKGVCDRRLTTFDQV
jgi:hypothetical protein